VQEVEKSEVISSNSYDLLCRKLASILKLRVRLHVLYPDCTKEREGDALLYM
jgi:hypothetical protein